MIDTFRLNLIDCEIKRSANLSIQPGYIDNSSGKVFNENDLFIDTSGRIVKGAKAYYNHEKFNLTIQPTVEPEMNEFNKSKLVKKKFHRINSETQTDIFNSDYDDEVKGIFLQTSLPRIINENNLKNLSVEEQLTALKELENLLKQSGIKTNILNAKLSRVDTFTNLKTEFPFYSYADLLSLMELSRMKAVGYGNESFLWKNGNQQLMIYDKITEMKSKNPALKFTGNKNIMRFENRLLKKRSIESKLKFLTVDELYKNYDHLRSYHKKEVENKIFKYSFEDINRMTIDDLDTVFEFCRKQFKEKWFEKFKSFNSFRSILRVADENYLLEKVEQFDSNKKAIAVRVKKYRLRKEYREMKLYVSMYENQFKKGILKSNVELYNELKQKFYKEVA